MNLAKSAERIAGDLLNLEINTIIASGMVAQKMPEPGHALLDIAKHYQGYLQNAYAQIDAAQHSSGITHAEAIPRVELRQCYADDATFFALREQADSALAAREQLRRAGIELGTDEDAILLRIQRNCDLLRSLFRGLADRGVVIKPDEISRNSLATNEDVRRKLALLPHEMVALRKIWDLGTSRVVMQTVVQLDGDVVNRIQQGCETSTFKCLHDAHGELVRTSLGQWQFLAKTVAEFAGSMVKRIF